MPESKQYYSKCIWFTGLSGAGKTTLAKALQIRLNRNNIPSVLLDGDILRKGVNNDLGFTPDVRNENIRRAAEMAKIILESNVIVICAFISPTDSVRLLAKQIVGKDNYLQIFVNTPLKVCIDRDPKGLYKKALSGEIKDFTGIDAIFELPKSPDLIIETTTSNLETGVNQNLLLLKQRMSSHITFHIPQKDNILS